MSRAAHAVLEVCESYNGELNRDWGYEGKVFSGKDKG